jgi:SET domain
MTIGADHLVLNASTANSKVVLLCVLCDEKKIGCTNKNEASEYHPVPCKCVAGQPSFFSAGASTFATRNPEHITKRKRKRRRLQTGGFMDSQSNKNSDHTTFDHLLKRLEALERWRELAVRPDECCEDDMDLLAESTDNVRLLSQRCLQARDLVNAHLPIVKGPHDDVLVPRPSSIPESGLGLFYEASAAFPCGHVLCYYYGHIHNFHSARSLQETNYLMLVEGDVLVDPGPLPHILARYINDPLNEAYVNCRYVPDAAHHRSKVVTTREIQPGEELFSSYGEAYWSQHVTPGRWKA